MVINTIVKGILDYVGLDNKTNWYVGIAENPKKRLFIEHNVRENGNLWIYYDANSEINARDTEKYLLERYSFKGGVGGGIHPTYVYAYKITPYTKK